MRWWPAGESPPRRQLLSLFELLRLDIANTLHEKTFDKKTGSTLHEHSFDEKTANTLHENTFDKKTGATLYEDTYDEKTATSLHEKTFNEKTADTLHEKTFDAKSVNTLHENTFDKKTGNTLHENTFGEKTPNAVQGNTFDKKTGATLHEDTFDEKTATTLHKNTVNEKTADIGTGRWNLSLEIGALEAELAALVKERAETLEAELAALVKDRADMDKKKEAEEKKEEAVDTDQGPAIPMHSGSVVAPPAHLVGGSKPEVPKPEAKKREKSPEKKEYVKFPLGTRVTANKLQGAPELNGKHGTVVEWSKEKGRFGVKFDHDGLEKLLKPDNLEGKKTVSLNFNVEGLDAVAESAFTVAEGSLSNEQTVSFAIEEVAGKKRTFALSLFLEELDLDAEDSEGYENESDDGRFPDWERTGISSGMLASNPILIDK